MHTSNIFVQFFLRSNLSIKFTLPKKPAVLEFLGKFYRGTVHQEQRWLISNFSMLNFQLVTKNCFWIYCRPQFFITSWNGNTLLIFKLNFHCSALLNSLNYDPDLQLVNFLSSFFIHLPLSFFFNQISLCRSGRMNYSFLDSFVEVLFISDINDNATNYFRYV